MFDTCTLLSSILSTSFVFNAYKMIGIQTFCLQRLFLLDVTQGRLPGAQMTPIRTGN